MWQRLLGFIKGNPVKSALAAALLLTVAALVCADALLAGPVRTWAERTINSNLKGYRVRIARARPRIYKLGLVLDGLVLTQNSHPDPPVADFAALEFTLQWSQLVRFKVAADLTLRRPALHIDLAQMQEEAASKVSLKEEGWQRAVEAIYPFNLDQVRIQDGSLLYLAAAPTSKPLQLTGITMLAKNIRNQAAAQGTYPSPVTCQAALFDTGQVWFKGAADFLREPTSAAMGEIHLERVPLDRLGPLAQDYNLRTTGGLLSANGTIEYTPETQKAHLTEVRFEDLRVDYVTSRATKAQEAAHVKQALQLAKAVRNSPRVVLQVDSLGLSRSQIGFMNQTATPPYRLFLSDVSLQLTNLSNQANHGRSEFRARGAFMGSGRTVLSGGFLSTAKPADFAIHLQLDDARLTDLNKFLLAQTGVDVADGLFSVYTELTVKGGRVEGYLKPLVKNLRVSDQQKDRAKPLGKRVEMHVLQWLANLFKNRSSKQVATVTRISGSTSDPRLSEWEAIRKLLGNGLFRAILPGFLDKGKEGRPDKAAS
jgi:hypothetical protein